MRGDEVGANLELGKSSRLTRCCGLKRGKTENLLLRPPEWSPESGSEASELRLTIYARSGAAHATVVHAKPEVVDEVFARICETAISSSGAAHAPTAARSPSRQQTTIFFGFKRSSLSPPIRIGGQNFVRNPLLSRGGSPTATDRLRQQNFMSLR